MDFLFYFKIDIYIYKIIACLTCWNGYQNKLQIYNKNIIDIIEYNSLTSNSSWLTKWYTFQRKEVPSTTWCNSTHHLVTKCHIQMNWIVGFNRYTILWLMNTSCVGVACISDTVDVVNSLLCLITLLSHDVIWCHQLL